MTKPFQFKQFSVAHDRCGMKVGTDSIILGSWCQTQQAKRILDIGTGSGVLALMLAQKSNADANITAIEIDAEAVLQARENVAASPWPNKVEVLHTPLQGFASDGQFDLIISNPPYYPVRSYHKNDAGASRRVKSRQIARQQDKLSLGELIGHVKRMLTPNGHFYCVLPKNAETELKLLLNKHQLFSQGGLQLRSTPEKAAQRQLWHISQKPNTHWDDELIICSETGKYSYQMRQLCQDYYLHF